jgi:hypothetical protein
MPARPATDRADVEPRDAAPLDALEAETPAGAVEAETRPARVTAAELLERPGALLQRRHLHELGLERRAVDAVFRALPVVILPGYSRKMIRAEDYRRLIRDRTYSKSQMPPPRTGVH